MGVLNNFKLVATVKKEPLQHPAVYNREFYEKGTLSEHYYGMPAAVIYRLEARLGIEYAVATTIAGDKYRELAHSDAKMRLLRCLYDEPLRILEQLRRAIFEGKLDDQVALTSQLYDLFTKVEA